MAIQAVLPPIQHRELPLGLRALAIGVSIAKLAPLLIAVGWLIVSWSSNSSDQCTDGACRDNEIGFVIALFAVVLGLLFGGTLFGVQIAVSIRQTAVSLAVIGVVLVIVDLALISLAIISVADDGSFGRVLQLVFAYAVVVMLAQLSATVWAVAAARAE